MTSQVAGGPKGASRFLTSGSMADAGVERGEFRSSPDSQPSGAGFLQQSGAIMQIQLQRSISGGLQSPG